MDCQPPASLADRPFIALIGRFPDMAALARALDVPHSTVAAWKRRDRIPEDRWRAIAAAAKGLKVKGVSYDALADAAEKRRLLPDPPVGRRGG
jgi:hypothetical protein